MQDSLNRKLWIYLVMVALVIAAAWFAHRHIAITLTPSLRYAVFVLLTKPDKGLRRGDYVLFTLDHPMTKKLGFSKAVKEVVCAGGDRMIVSGKDYYCNGAHLGRAKDKSLEGVPVDNFRFKETVPEGSLFVMGHTIDSFDSRYFGFISVSDVEKTAYPLF